MKNEIPYCHSEPMQPSYRYKGGDGRIYRVFICGLCNRKEEVIFEEDEKSYYERFVR